MVVCGLKVSHDAGIAVVADGALVFSVEIEKTGNSYRHATLHDLRLVEETLAAHGLAVEDVDSFVVDGRDEPAPTSVDGRKLVFEVADYADEPPSPPLRARRFSGLLLDGVDHGYRSYPHTVGHAAGGFAASPFAARGEDAYVLVWDGGVAPRLYHAAQDPPSLTLADPSLMPFLGSVYPGFAMQFAPFESDDLEAVELSIPGKVMAYAALGAVQPELVEAVEAFAAGCETATREFGIQAGRAVAGLVGRAYTSADAFASLQSWLGDRLLAGLDDALARRAADRPNLVFTGGCALNIVWNSKIRDAGIADVWIPPFANDSGSALGAACADAFARLGWTTLDWDVYSGPALAPSELPTGWRAKPCDVAAVARLLAATGEPVVVLNGRAELGPRALGHRSVIAPAGDPAMQDRLNAIKGREWYRPVAPVVLEHRAPDVFDPGTPDPYMLFTHRVRDGWHDRIPAVVHVDGTARLQTIRHEQDPVLAELLEAYEALTGVPVLCNTSANLQHRGFFPDVSSALSWNGTSYVWSDGVLYAADRAAAEAARSAVPAEATAPV